MADTSGQPPRHYHYNLDDGPLDVTIPERLSAGEAEDIELLFTLILKHAKRRAAPPAGAPEGE